MASLGLKAHPEVFEAICDPGATGKERACDIIEITLLFQFASYTAVSLVSGLVCISCNVVGFDLTQVYASVITGFVNSAKFQLPTSTPTMRQ